MTPLFLFAGFFIVALFLVDDGASYPPRAYYDGSMSAGITQMEYLLNQTAERWREIARLRREENQNHIKTINTLAQELGKCRMGEK